MNRGFLSLTGLVCLLAAGHGFGAEQADAQPQRYEQKKFYISFWVDPPADEITGERYRQIAEANFNLVLGGFGARTPERMQTQVALCDKYGLDVMLPVRDGRFDRVPDGDRVIGYSLRDEPNATDFAVLAEKVRQVRDQRPGKLAFINLFPTYASPEQLGTATYDEHVRRYVDEVNADVLCFDHYPRFMPGHDGREGYLENLAIIRAHALRAGIPFWNFFNIMPYGPHTDPTEAQVAWQVYASIAYGAKGVLYFCYWTPRGREFPKGGAIITAEGRPTRHYDQARRTNARLACLGPTLMKLTSEDVVRIKPGEDSAAKLAGSPVRTITDGDYIIGIFKHADGRDAVMLSNYEFAYCQWPTVEFAADLADVVEIDQTTGREVPPLDDSPDMPGMQLSLDAGCGRLFLMPASRN